MGNDGEFRPQSQRYRGLIINFLDLQAEDVSNPGCTPNNRWTRNQLVDLIKGHDFRFLTLVRVKMHTTLTHSDQDG